MLNFPCLFEANGKQRLWGSHLPGDRGRGWRPGPGPCLSDTKRTCPKRSSLLLLGLTRGCHWPQEYTGCNGQRRWGRRKVCSCPPLVYQEQRNKITKGLSDTKVPKARGHLYGCPFQFWISTSCITATYWWELSGSLDFTGHPRLTELSWLAVQDCWQ